MLVALGFEVSIGWPPSGDDPALVETFILQHWSSLRWIWGAQMLACPLVALSALLLLRSRHLESRGALASVLWAAVAIGGIVLTVTYGLILGSYPPALETPEIFRTVRGGARFLLFTGLPATGLALLLLFIGEGVTRDGAVPRSWLLGIAATVALAVLAVLMGLVPSRTVGAVGFLVPPLLGLGLWRAGRQLSPDTPQL